MTCVSSVSIVRCELIKIYCSLCKIFNYYNRAVYRQHRDKQLVQFFCIEILIIKHKLCIFGFLCLYCVCCLRMGFCDCMSTFYILYMSIYILTHTHLFDYNDDTIDNCNGCIQSNPTTPPQKYNSILYNRRKIDLHT